MIKFKKTLYEKAGVEDTDFFETSACLGAVMKPTLKKEMDQFLNAKIKPVVLLKSIKGSFDKKYDWSPKGVKIIKGIKTNELDKIVDLCKLAIGMYKFCTDVVKTESGIKTPYFIHNQIEKYYKIEKEVMGEIPGTKKNTADCIISNLNANDLLSLMKKNKPEPTMNGRFINVGKKGIMVPVSLKKSPGGAQLGKITTFLKKNLEFGVDAKEAIGKFEDKEIPSFKQALNEGLLDNLKGIISSAFDKFKNFVNNTVKKFSNKFVNIFKGKPDERYIRQFAMDMGLNESVLTEGKTGSRDLALANAVEKNPDKVLKIINKEFKSLSKMADGTKLVFHKTSLVKSIGKLKKNDKLQESFFLLANYMTVKTLQDLVGESKSIASTVNRLNAEMLFGGTKLPLWKVYGDYDPAHTYKFLGDLESFVKDKPKRRIELMGYRVNPSGQHYTVTVYILNEIDDNGNKIYSLLRTGTNSSSHITFTFEGTNLTKPIPLKKSLKDTWR